MTSNQKSFEDKIKFGGGRSRIKSTNSSATITFVSKIEYLVTSKSPLNLYANIYVPVSLGGINSYLLFDIFFKILFSSYFLSLLSIL